MDLCSRLDLSSLHYSDSAHTFVISHINVPSCFILISFCLVVLELFVIFRGPIHIFRDAC